MIIKGRRHFGLKKVEYTQGEQKSHSFAMHTVLSLLNYLLCVEKNIKVNLTFIYSDYIRAKWRLF